MPRLASMRWKKKPMLREWHASKPDRDNLEKAVLDAMKGIVFVDDSQACSGSVEKVYASGDEVSGVLITIETLDHAANAKGRDG